MPKYLIEDALMETKQFSAIDMQYQILLSAADQVRRLRYDLNC